MIIRSSLSTSLTIANIVTRLNTKTTVLLEKMRLLIVKCLRATIVIWEQFS